MDKVVLQKKVGWRIFLFKKGKKKKISFTYFSPITL